MTRHIVSARQAAEFSSVESVESRPSDGRAHHARAVESPDYLASAQANVVPLITDDFSRLFLNAELGAAATNFDSILAKLSESCLEWICATELPRLRSLGERVEFLTTQISRIYS